jgi:formamidopyrimidine-DNA glycosylase
MPELPEVETIRRYLDGKLVGKTIANIEVLHGKNYQGSATSPIGKSVTGTGRKGKVMNMALDDGTYLSVHLKMSGQLLYADDRKNATFPVKIPLADDGRMPGRTTRVVIDFIDGSALFFNDLRKFGWVKHSDTPDGTDAPDPTRPDFTLDYFRSVVSRSRKPLKTMLLDQDKISGVGNIYANDALFEAKILPSRTGNSLRAEEIGALYESVKKIIAEGVRYRGTSASAVYVSPDGTKGSYQDHFRVYGREGAPCHECGTTIVREKSMGRSNFFCPSCQH